MLNTTRPDVGFHLSNTANVRLVFDGFFVGPSLVGAPGIGGAKVAPVWNHRIIHLPDLFF